MTILALEFSSPQRSVAVARGNSVSGETIETGGRGTAAFSLIEKVLSDAGIRREEVEAIAVGLGPGSYTGIRSAIAIAQGWQLARGTQLIGISSVEAIAAQAQSEIIFGKVNVVIDAQRNELYFARYKISSEDRHEVEPLKILAESEWQSRKTSGEIFVGPEVTRFFPEGRVLFPRALELVSLATDDRFAAEKLEPIYLREPGFLKTPISNQRKLN